MRKSVFFGSHFAPPKKNEASARVFGIPLQGQNPAMVTGSNIDKIERDPLERGSILTFTTLHGLVDGDEVETIFFTLTPPIEVELLAIN